MITKTLFGRTPDNEDVYLYTLTNKNKVSIEIMNYGGIIKSIKTPDKDLNISEITLGFESLTQYLENPPFFGALVGRYAGRIKGAKFNLNGKTYSLAKNDGDNHLHGGNVGFNKKVWDSRISGDKLMLTYFSPDGEENYPGNLQVTATYSLDDGNRLSIEYNATTDADTIINMTNHAYFNLSGEQDVLTHSIQIDADRVVPLGKELIPTGELSDVASTPLDLRTPAKIGDRIGLPNDQLKNGGGFDIDFIINKNGEEIPCCSVYSEKTGRMLEVFTTSPVVHLYTGNFLDEIGLPKSAGLCLEAQGYSDAINNPGFPSPILRPGEVYKHKTVYKFSVISGR